MHTIAHFDDGPLAGETRVIEGDRPDSYTYSVYLGESQQDSDAIRTRTGHYRIVHEPRGAVIGRAHYRYVGMR